MTTADLERTVQDHTDASPDQLADDIYMNVQAELAGGADRSEIYATLHRFYEDAKSRGDRKTRRAVGEVLAAMDGWCAPSATL